MSEKNMDDLLAQLKEEFEPQSREKKNSGRHVNHSQSQPNTQPPTKTTSSESMSEMLKELEQKLEEHRPTSQNRSNRQKQAPKINKKEVRKAHQLREQLNILIEQDYQMQARKREAQAAEVKRIEAAKIQAEQKRQQELQEIQRREAIREQRREEALRDKAVKWLKDLKPRSEEGKWFEEFAYSYENRLDAAVDYLKAMQESGL